MNKRSDGDMEEQIQRMFANMKTQVQNPLTPENSFMLHQIMYLHINFHKIAKKKVVINAKNNDDECFKWAFITVPHHKDIGNNSDRISKLLHYETSITGKKLSFL